MKCRYCDGKGGRYKLVYSRFVGIEPQVHQGPWEPCWFCGGSGKTSEAVMKAVKEYRNPYKDLA